MNKRQMHLNLFIHSRGHHEASWRHPLASPLPLTDIRYYQDLAQRAERPCSIPSSSRSIGARRRRLAGRALLARARHGARRDRAGHQPHRAHRHLLHDLHRAVQSGAAVRLARSHQQRPHRLEHRDVVARDRGAQLRRLRSSEPLRPLRPGRRVHVRGQGAVGQLGRGRGGRRSHRRALRQSASHPADQSQGRALRGRGPAQPAAHAARTPGAGAGRLVRCRPALCRPPRRGGVHRAYGEDHRAGVLCRSQSAGEGGRPRSEPSAHPAGLQPDDRLDRSRGAALGAGDQRTLRC